MLNISESIYNNCCFRLNHLPESWTLKVYQENGGYKVWQDLVTGKISPEEVIEIVKESGLRGRGGAGFPTGIKWSFMNRHATGQKYLVCNSDEGEPGTFKDRDIMTYNPHQLVEGMAIGCYVIGATVGYNYIRGEFWLPYQRFNNAVLEARAAGMLGDNLFGSEVSVDLFTHLGAGAYICGEETALLESLEGKKGQPRFKPPFPASYGLYGKPTTINNTESIASIPVILSKGAAWFKGLGVENSGGCKCFSISGHVEKPGNQEVNLGTSFAVVLENAGGVWQGRKLKAVIPGGSSTPVIPAAKAMQMNMDYDSIASANSMLGAGSIIIMDDHTDMVLALERLTWFYHEESCGQCTPCREGTGWLYRIVNRIVNGKGKMEDLELLKDLSTKINGRTICALGDAACVPVASFLQHFENEFVHYVQKGRSIFNV